MSDPCRKLDVEIHTRSCPDGEWKQARYLVHLHDDVLWTDDLNAVVEALRESLEKLEEEP